MGSWRFLALAILLVGAGAQASTVCPAGGGCNQTSIRYAAPGVHTGAEFNTSQIANEAANNDNSARLDALLAVDTCTTPPCALAAGTTLNGAAIQTGVDDDVPESGDFGAAADLEADGSISPNSVTLGVDTVGNYAGSSSEGGPATSVVANSVALGTDTTGNYAGSASEGGPATSATTATALAADGTNAPAGNAILGVDASGNAQGQFDVLSQAENTAQEAARPTIGGSNTVPGTCIAGSIYFDLDDNLGLFCTATNTWGKKWTTVNNP